MAASGFQILEFDSEVNFWCASVEDLMVVSNLYCELRSLC